MIEVYKITQNYTIQKYRPILGIIQNPVVRVRLNKVQCSTRKKTVANLYQCLLLLWGRLCTETCPQ